MTKKIRFFIRLFYYEDDFSIFYSQSSKKLWICLGTNQIIKIVERNCIMKKEKFFSIRYNENKKIFIKMNYD